MELSTARRNRAISASQPLSEQNRIVMRDWLSDARMQMEPPHVFVVFGASVIIYII
jgi:hypothetical protein